jgi:hypothetical protein
MFTPKHIIVSGTGKLAHLVTEQLDAAGGRARRVDDLDAGGTLLRSARVLILADPGEDFGRLADRLRNLCGSRPSKRPTLRVILLHRGSPAPSLPEPDADAPLTLESFDLQRQAARAILARWPLHTGMDPAFGQRVHLLIAGSAPPARALVLQALRLMHYGDLRPMLTLAHSDPDRLREEWLAEVPRVQQFCDLVFSTYDDPTLSGTPPVTSAFVCEDPPQKGLETAQKLARLIAARQGASPLIHLETGEAEPKGDVGDWDGQILPFSWLREACRPQALIDGREDELARVIHQHYRDSIAAQGRDPAAEPAGRPWETLAASYRDANRQQADHLWAKLAVSDCRAVREDLVEYFAFSPLEAERLAVIEHARWAADRYLDGWTYAPVRDNARRHHPQLVPYTDLSDPMKDLDRFAVRLIPTLLARSGRGVVRMLIVGIPEPGDSAAAQGRIRHRVESRANQALERLARRYPDRSLVLAATLAGPASRLVVRRALERFEAGLFLLCPQALPETISAQPDERSRRDLLGLAAGAERRIHLRDPEELTEWFAQRAEILMLLGAANDMTEPRKQVQLDSAGGRLEWTFEY